MLCITFLVRGEGFVKTRWRGAWSLFRSLCRVCRIVGTVSESNIEAVILQLWSVGFSVRRFGYSIRFHASNESVGDLSIFMKGCVCVVS